MHVSQYLYVYTLNILELNHIEQLAHHSVVLVNIAHRWAFHSPFPLIPSESQKREI